MNIPYGRAAAIRRRRADLKRSRSGSAALADGGVLQNKCPLAPSGCHWVSSPHNDV